MRSPLLGILLANIALLVVTNWWVAAFQRPWTVECLPRRHCVRGNCVGSGKHRPLGLCILPRRRTRIANYASAGVEVQEEVKPAAWSGVGMTQDEFMLKDECVVVNYMDEVVGHDNKYNCHKFVPGQPKGIVHRAFSVMLFDAEGRILLQQRAASKITFPNVWTNTCCSHPLHGMQPAEVDTPEVVAAGDPRGVKHAAIRKLGHELGIRSNELQVDRFRFMTRVHYWAADTITHGSDAPWGEHEIDYLLLYRLEPGEMITLEPNEEEVQSVRWLSSEDLRVAMGGGDDELAKSMPLWSPWFRVIAARFLHTWWQDLDAAITTNEYLDVSSIHRFDAPVEHLGGAGHAKPSLDKLYAAEQQSEVGRRELALDAGREDLQPHH